MILDLLNETDFYLPEQTLRAIERALTTALEYEGFSREAELSIIIADNEKLRALNKRHGKKDAATDVLSFPAHNFIPGDYASIENKGEPVYLGDVAISIERAVKQSEEYGHSLLRELAFLAVHSILHLLGYDHTDDETEMFKKQAEILAKAGIQR